MAGVLPTASVEVDLEPTSGDDQGIIQDTAFVDAAAWAQMNADITTFAASYGYTFNTYAAPAGQSYTGGYFTDEQSVKNWIAAVHAQGNLATAPTDGSAPAAAPAAASSGTAVAVVGGVVVVGLGLLALALSKA